MSMTKPPSDRQKPAGHGDPHVDNELLPWLRPCRRLAGCPAGGQVPAPCTADFNNNGVASVQDIFDFLAAWFGGDPQADINGNGFLSVQDIFDLLNAYFAGCPAFAGNPNPHDMGYSALGMPACHLTMTAMRAATCGIVSGVHPFSA